jgi:tetratricopeptide (TPR) repeat protein
VKLNASKLLVPLLAVALLAGSCGGGKGDAGGRPEDVTGLRETKAKDIKPPEHVDPKNIALPGLTLGTNSPSWEKLVGSAKGRGAVVLFVQPGGPADNKGIARGDLITEVDGKRITNYEYALTALRSRRGEQREVKLTSRRGNERTVKLKGAPPTERARPFLNGMIKGNSHDPVLRYLRAEAPGGTAKANLDDLDAALRRQPEFVEALAARGNLIFNLRLSTKDKAKQNQFRDEALANWKNALSIDPRNAFALGLRANAQNAAGNPTQGKSDATQALKVDPNIASASHALARADIALKKLDDAAGPAAAAIKLNPYSNLTYYRTLAEIFKGLKRKSDCSATLLAVVPYLEGTGAPALKKEADHIKIEARDDCG